MTTKSTKMRRKVHNRIKVAPDLELHISALTVAGQRLVEIRNYVPSSKTYGRGATAPLSALDGLHEGIHNIVQAETTVTGQVL